MLERSRWLLQLQVDAHLLALPVGELPGVGWALNRKLAELGIETVSDVRGCATPLPDIRGLTWLILTP